MADNARRADDSCEWSPSGEEDPFSLEAYLEHQRVAYADGPTVAEILLRADARRAGGVPRELIAASIREDREARGGC